MEQGEAGAAQLQRLSIGSVGFAQLTALTADGKRSTIDKSVSITSG
jgi:hypothetical protein